MHLIHDLVQLQRKEKWSLMVQSLGLSRPPPHLTEIASFRGPKTTLRFNPLLERLKNSETLFYSLFGLIIVKEYKLKSTEKCGGQETASAEFPGILSQWSTADSTHFSQHWCVTAGREHCQTQLSFSVQLCVGVGSWSPRHDWPPTWLPLASKPCRG